MPTALYGAVGLVLVAVVSGVVTWLVARRTKSGKIDTSEAAVLWDEGTKMRLELRDEVISLRAQLTEAVEAITNLNGDIRRSRAETEAAREETRLSRLETRRLMEQIDEIHKEVRTNGPSIGRLAEDAETRRITAIPEADRSPEEKVHMKAAFEREHPSGKGGV